jgi:hypothetical protein
VKVPDDWWPAFSGQAVNAGMIAGVDFDIDMNNHFQLKLDKEQGVYYTMRYDAIVFYANKTNCSFSSFFTPAYALRNPVDDVVEVDMVNDDDNNDDFIMPPCACNKKCCLKKKHPTIIHDSSVFGKEGTADEESDELATSNDAIGTVDEPEQSQAPPLKFTMTAKEDWTRIGAAQRS